MLRRLLNIGSIVCLVLCVALMGMWVRSYRRMDAISATAGKNDFVFGSERGVIFCGGNGRIGTAIATGVWATDSDMSGDEPFPQPSFLLFHLDYNQAGMELLIPFWFLALVAGLLSALFWWKHSWRFTLRSLFIATTFLALVPGMIAWLDRAWIGK